MTKKLLLTVLIALTGCGPAPPQDGSRRPAAADPAEDCLEESE